MMIVNKMKLRAVKTTLSTVTLRIRHILILLFSLAQGP